MKGKMQRGFGVVASLALLILTAPAQAGGMGMGHGGKMMGPGTGMGMMQGGMMKELYLRQQSDMMAQC